MPPGVMLMVSLAALYILAMGIFWQCLWGQQPQEPVVMEVPFALQAGQTILGVDDTTQDMHFAIGDYVREEHYDD
jgi:hypothetical protein